MLQPKTIYSAKSKKQQLIEKKEEKRADKKENS